MNDPLRELLPDRFTLFWFEYRRRLRGQAGFRWLGVFVLVLTIGLLVATILQPPNSWANARELPAYGRSLWMILCWIELAVVVLISPALTANTFSGERESHTLDQLLLTRLSTVELVWEKYFAALAQVLLLLLAGLPVTATLSALYGGIALWEVAATGLLLVVASLAAGLFGLVASCQVRTTAGAVGRAYLYLFLFLIANTFCFPVGVFLGPLALIMLLPAMAISSVEKMRMEFEAQLWLEDQPVSDERKAAIDTERARRRANDTPGCSPPNLSGRE